MTQDNNGMGSSSEMSIEELREELAKIDRELVELIAQRTYVAYSMSEIKRERGLPIVDEEQEAEVLHRAEKNAEKYDVDENLTKAVFRMLIELNKIEQRENL